MLRFQHGQVVGRQLWLAKASKFKKGFRVLMPESYKATYL